MRVTAPRLDRHDAHTRARISRLSQTVELLASLQRRTGTLGERRSGELIAAELERLGADSVRISRFRTQTSWGPAGLAHVAAGLVAGLCERSAARLAGAAIAISYELDVSARNQWVRRLLPASRGTTVTARVPAEAERHRSLIVVAHHDAAHGGLLWHPAVVAANRVWSARTGRTMPTHLPLLVAMAAAAAPSRAVRRAAGAVMGVSALAMIESMRSATTPGANDNATGVATALELARQFSAAPLEHTDVSLVFPGGEEISNTGMRAWIHSARSELDPSTTLVVNLDALGSGGHLVVSAREGLTAWYAKKDIQVAVRLAQEVGVDLQRVTFPNVSDAFVARRSGLRTISLLSYADGWIPNLHRPTDTPDRVRWNTVEDALALTDRIASVWDRGDV